MLISLQALLVGLMPRKLTIEEFIVRSNAIHSMKYSYNKVIFKGTTKKVTITCPIHGDFEQTPMGHLSGRGCSKCASMLHSNRMSLDTSTFILKAQIIHNMKYFPTINMWKVGVTSLSITERFSSEPLPYKVLEVIQFDLVKDAYNLEVEVLREYKDYRYIGPKVLRTGSTELLTIDISEYINTRLKEG